MLAHQIFGTAVDRPALVIAHGLFGSGRNWGVIARRLADQRRVVTVDMRNHGGSAWFGTHTYRDMAADLAELIETLGVPADLLGHSMGGKAAMVLALTRPDLVAAAVIADIAPVAYGHSQMGPIQAMRGVDLASVQNRTDAGAEMLGITDGERQFLLQSLDLKERRWRLNLDVLASEMAKIVGFPAVDGRYDGRVLFLSGAQSDYVRPEYRDRIRQLFPAAKFAQLKGAGHWLHADKPREFEAAVREFLDR